MKTLKGSQQYYQLIIKGDSPEVDIWLGDDEGYFVQKAEGELNTSLLPGKYIVEFGLGTQCYPITLSQNARLSQNESEEGPVCKRPKPNINK